MNEAQIEVMSLLVSSLESKNAGSFQKQKKG